MITVVIFFILLCFNNVRSDKDPTVLIAILARNKAHTLPYFLSALENLYYSKDRIAFCDNNIDNTIEILNLWINSVGSQYHAIYTFFDKNSRGFSDEIGPTHWTSERFKHVISLREKSLNHARKVWADYYLSLDCDVFLTNRNALQYLIKQNTTVVSPMLRSEGLYSNFWHGMTEEYYYYRTEEYKPILFRENTGCFAVPMVHSCVLVDLKKEESDFLTYVPDKIKNFQGPVDDIIAFAIGANYSGISLSVCNEQRFGFIMAPLEKEDKLELDREQMINIKLEALTSDEPLIVDDIFKKFIHIPTKTTLGFEKVFMINLLRRPERRKRMMDCFAELGLDVTVFDAVDGKALNENMLNTISFMPEFVDPYHKRPMTLGEIGCFLSHYRIWQEVVLHSYETTLVLEDDIRFESFFRLKVPNVMGDLKFVPDWDLVYFGRKRLQENDEPFVEGSSLLVRAGYSYWTLGYAVSLKGARKLLDADPLSRLVPVDEYLPILFNKHPQDNWKGHFPKRDLVALSAAPLLVYPTHYTGESGYISDTENSTVVEDPSNRIREDL